MCNMERSQEVLIARTEFTELHLLGEGGGEGEAGGSVGNLQL